eukprot:Nk52_evm9s377 gene=Nk52_evmTU9s377
MVNPTVPVTNEAPASPEKAFNPDVDPVPETGVKGMDSEQRERMSPIQIMAMVLSAATEIAGAVLALYYCSEILDNADSHNSTSEKWYAFFIPISALVFVVFSLIQIGVAMYTKTSAFSYFLAALHGSVFFPSAFFFYNLLISYKQAEFDSSTEVFVIVDYTTKLLVGTIGYAILMGGSFMMMIASCISYTKFSIFMRLRMDGANSVLYSGFIGLWTLASLAGLGCVYAAAGKTYSEIVDGNQYFNTLSGVNDASIWTYYYFLYPALIAFVDVCGLIYFVRTKRFHSMFPVIHIGFFALVLNEVNVAFKASSEYSYVGSSSSYENAYKAGTILLTVSQFMGGLFASKFMMKLFNGNSSLSSANQERFEPVRNSAASMMLNMVNSALIVIAAVLSMVFAVKYNIYLADDTAVGANGPDTSDFTWFLYFMIGVMTIFPLAAFGLRIVTSTHVPGALVILAVLPFIALYFLRTIVMVYDSQCINSINPSSQSPIFYRSFDDACLYTGIGIGGSGLFLLTSLLSLFGIAMF